MHILCISLTGKKNQGARAIQMAKVIRALQDQGAYVTVITRKNDKLTDFDRKAGRIICVDPSMEPESKPGSSSFLSKVAGGILPQWEFTTRMAVKKALEVIDSDRPDCIFSSSNPVSSHFAGMKIAQISGLPWLASFSDPKPSTMLPPPYGSKLKRLIPKGYTPGLRKVLQQCDAVHMPTRICLQITEQYYNTSIAGKSFAIPPIGETNFNLKKQHAGNGYLVHLGSITKRLSGAFSQAVARFAKDNPETFKGVIFVGKHHKKTDALIKKYGIESIVQTKPQVSHQEALDMISKAGAVLILEADMAFSHALPSKFAEAAFSGTPILAVTPRKSAVRDYMKKYGGGFAAFHSGENILKGLNHIFTMNPEGFKQLREEQTRLAEEFSFKKIGDSYMEVFRHIIDLQKAGTGNIAAR